MSNKVKIAIVALIVFFLAWGYVAKQQAENNKPMFTELRNETAVKTAEVEREMQTECTRAFPLYGDKLTPKCWDLIMELWDRGYTVNWNDQGEFRMELTQ